jgi:manganese/iron transport system permease protein
LDFSIFGYQFMQNAILSAFLGGVACATVGVFVVLMHMPFIGVCMSHAAFAGALLGLWLGFNPLIGALALSLLAAAIIGPLADRGELNPETSVGVIFSLMLGLAFLFMGLMPGTKSGALELLWGSILTNTRSDIILLGIVAIFVVGLVFLFYKEVQATVFHRDMALAVGIPATLVLYGILFLTGATITATLRSIGGILIFSLILNPAAAAYQLTYSMRRMFLLSAGFGVLSGWTGLLFSYLFNIPSGATIVVTSSVIFMIKAYFNEKAVIWDETAAEKDATKLEEMAGRLAIEPGSRVLDVGTGTGVFVPFILRRVGQNGQLVCLDLAEEMLKRARAKGFEGNVDYICADIANTWFDDETFDAVVCYSSFPHFQDKSGALREINRVLKGGGTLFICHTSSRYQINEVHRQIPSVQNDLIPDEAEMRQLLSAAGFAEISIQDNKDNYLTSARKPQA